ncbi:MAG: ABC transporter permease, partial [Acidobacteriota bacterium]
MRAYRVLLQLYPRSFRAEYGDEMAAIFVGRRRDAIGVNARAALWIGVVLDTLASALAVHFDILRQDLRYTARALARSKDFAATAIAIVALGVGANTATFAVTDFVLLRPLPFPASNRLVSLWQSVRDYSRLELSPANYRDWTQAATSFQQVGAYTDASLTLVGQGDPIRLEGTAVTASLFPTLAVGPRLGRTFTGGEDAPGATPTVVLSDRVWRTVFGADESIIGRTVVLNDRAHTVIGVMGPSFSFPTSQTGLWVPLAFDDDAYSDRTNTYLRAVARLRPEASVDGARTEMALIADRFARQFKDNDHTGAAVTALHDDVSRQSRAMVLALSAAAFCVLLIVCANLANLLLARGLSRRQELAVRAAMGAGRARLVRQLATESLVLGGLGGGLGILLAAAIVPLITRLVPATLPTAASPSIDLRVLLFAFALTAVTALAFGLAPVMRGGAIADVSALGHGARTVGGRHRLRDTLVIGEVVASLVLLVVTGLLMRALWTIQTTDPGFRPADVVTMRTTLPWPKYSPTAKRADFYARVLEQVRALPGVSSAG